MDYEKKYKEAIERAKIWQEHLYDVNDKDYADELNYIFPELAELEDERIKERIIALVNAHGQGMYKDKMLAWFEQRGELKPAEWSEDDEKQARQIERIIHVDGCTQKLQKQIAEWLKSLKGRVQPQPRLEWSEKDEQTFIESVEALEDFGKFELADWLKEHKNKFLKSQSHWKPSDMELEVLRLAAEKDGACLMGLYEQLKKLRKE